LKWNSQLATGELPMPEEALTSFAISNAYGQFAGKSVI